MTGETPATPDDVETTPTAESDAPKETRDHLGTFIRFADAVQANAERAHRPVYAETCPCGGSVEVGRDVTAAERRRIHAVFCGRHRDCLTRVPGRELEEGVRESAYDAGREDHRAHDCCRKVREVLVNSCHHCGRLPDDDGDHTCSCPRSDSECLEHTADPVVSLNAIRAALSRVIPPDKGRDAAGVTPETTMTG